MGFWTPSPRLPTAPSRPWPTTPPASPSGRRYEKFVWDNLRRNYLGNYLHGMLGMTGFRLVNAPTFLPAYLHHISGSNAIVGLGLALQQVGGVISPIFGATKIEHRTKVMPAAMWMVAAWAPGDPRDRAVAWFVTNKRFTSPCPGAGRSGCSRWCGRCCSAC